MAKEQIEKLSSDYQALQEQLQSLALQKAQFTEQMDELNDALEELKNAKGKVYSAIGGVMVETTKDDATKSVKERQESTEMRLTIINKQYDEAVKKEKALREQIEGMIKGSAPGNAVTQ